MDAKFHSCVDSVIDGKDKRPWKRKPSFIVIHHTGTGGRKLSKLLPEKVREYFRNVAAYLGKADDTFVSAHIQIGRFGEVCQIIDPLKYVAFQAGTSEWFDELKQKVLKGCNDFSIGIELLGDGNIEPYTQEQIEKLVVVIKALQEKIPSLGRDRIAGHQHISPGRKVDPGKYFPWAELESRLGVKLKLKSQGRAV
jgi:N-acetyl-anhydromuramoyl-L-alanine amidase